MSGTNHDVVLLYCHCESSRPPRPRRNPVPEAVQCCSRASGSASARRGLTCPAQVAPGGRAAASIVLEAAGDPHGVDDVVPDDAGVATDPDVLVVLSGRSPESSSPGAEPGWSPGFDSRMNRRAQELLPLIWWSTRYMVFNARQSSAADQLRSGRPARLLKICSARAGLVSRRSTLDEEVRLVLHDRPAEHAAELVLVVRRLLDARVLRELLGVEVVRAKSSLVVGAVAEAGAGPLVRPPLGHRVDDGAAGAAELGVELPADNLGTPAPTRSPP